MKSDIRKAKKAIMAAKSIMIASHISPDGDSIGSLLSLGLGLEYLNKRVYRVSADGLPRNFRLLPGAKKVVRSIDKSVDLAIAVDCGEKKLLGRTFETFKKAGHILEIDHHDIRTSFGDISFVDTKAGAVGEMIFMLLKELKIPLTKAIAENIMTSIVVETNSFRLPKIRAFTFEVCSDLVKAGVNFYELAEMVYWTKSKESFLLTNTALSRCTFLAKGRLVWSLLKQTDFDKINAMEEDAYAIAGELLLLKGVEIAIFFREISNNRLQVSLRSRGKINIGVFAERNGGGGHFDVAGCTIPNKKSAIDRFIRGAKSLVKRAR
ncbi:MAG: DHH family phosphoesterase [Candidatus Omnitrophota bacterium]|nr:DHH family phosphoesterase [Candidatus Omnitrophota bacterium]